MFPARRTQLWGSLGTTGLLRHNKPQRHPLTSSPILFPLHGISDLPQCRNSGEVLQSGQSRMPWRISRESSFSQEIRGLERVFRKGIWERRRKQGGRLSVQCRHHQGTRGVRRILEVPRGCWWMMILHECRGGEKESEQGQGWLSAEEGGVMRGWMMTFGVEVLLRAPSVLFGRMLHLRPGWTGDETRRLPKGHHSDASDRCRHDPRNPGTCAFERVRGMLNWRCLAFD